jgi:NitT/TauT family transport system substrate-binding protein
MRIIRVFRRRYWGVILVLLAAALVRGSAGAQTSVKFTLDWKFEGPAAPFLVAVDRGYFAAENLEVMIEPGNGSLEPINRVASGAYDMGFGDINTLIKFRDQKRGAPLKAVFMVYNKPPGAIVARKSRGITVPKDLEGKKLGAPAMDAAFAQWPIFVQTTGIDARKVTIVDVGFAAREPILAAGQVDAITGFSFSSYFTLKDRGVPTDDIVVMLMGDYGLKLYSNAIIVNAKFAAENPEAVKGFLRAFLKGLKDTVASPTHAIESVLRRNEDKKGGGGRTTANGHQRQYSDDGSADERLRRRGYRAFRTSDRSDRVGTQIQSKTERGGYLRCVVSSASWRTMGSLISNVVGGIASVSSAVSKHWVVESVVHVDILRLICEFQISCA